MQVRRWLAGAGLAGILATGGALLAVGSAGAAMAQGCTSGCTSAASSTTAASVNLTNQEQITDSTPAIYFASPVSLPANNEPSLTSLGPPAVPGGVSLTVSTNDQDGYSVSVANQVGCGGAGLTVAGSGCVSSIPAADFQVSGTATGGFVSAGSGAAVVTDSSLHASAPNGDSLTDNYQLTIPGGTAPGNYTTTLQYSVTAAS